jgi:Lysylphosphatidylglycerol synthase TM region
VLGAGSAVVALVLAVVAAWHIARTPWPFTLGPLGLLGAAALLSLLGYVFKAYGWRQLFAAHERPKALALAAANGGASITALALPGRFDDVVRVAIVRSFRGCPAGVRTICLSLFMLGLIDSVALAPFALAAAILPGQSLAVRLGLAFVAVVGFAAGGLILALPRVARSTRLGRFRLCRWLCPHMASLQDASQAWALVSAAWLTRVLGLLLVLGAFGVGFSFTLALLFLCTSSAAAALPVGPGGAAMQAGAGAAVLIASGVGVSEAVGVAVAVQTLGMLVGGSIFVVAAAWRTGVRLAPRYRSLRVRALRVRIAGEVQA